MPPKQLEAPLSEAQLLHLLAERHPAPAWAFLPHVANGTGFVRRTKRTADALALSLWPSRGLELHGFEVKSSRADWARELAAPEKAEEIARFCHRWWVVAGRDGMIPPADVPPAWGLLVPRGGKLVAVKEAAPQPAQALDMPMVCAILRVATETMVPKATLDAQVESAVKRARESAAAGEQVALRSAQRTLDDLRETVASFEKESGVKIGSRWDAGRIGRAVKLVLSLRHDGNLDVRTELERHRAGLQNLLGSIDELLAQTAPPKDPA